MLSLIHFKDIYRNDKINSLQFHRKLIMWHRRPEWMFQKVHQLNLNVGQSGIQCQKLFGLEKYVSISRSTLPLTGYNTFSSSFRS